MAYLCIIRRDAVIQHEADQIGDVIGFRFLVSQTEKNDYPELLLRRHVAVYNYALHSLSND